MLDLDDDLDDDDDDIIVLQKSIGCFYPHLSKYSQAYYVEEHSHITRMIESYCLEEFKRGCSSLLSINGDII